jgi:hypothetical protein
MARELAFGAAVLSVCLGVHLAWLGFDLRLRPRPSLLNDYWRARVPDVIYGRAHRPFVRRALVPSVVRGLRSVLGPEAARGLRRVVSRPPLRLPRKMGILGWEDEFLLEYALAACLTFLCLLGFALALRALIAGLFEAPALSLMAPPLAVLLLPPLFFSKGTHYLYDFATLFIVTGALAVLVRGRIVLFYVAVALGAWNKETILLLLPLFAVAEARRGWSRRRVALELLLLLGLIAGIQLALAWTFARNPGGAFEFNLVKNLRLVRSATGFLSLLLLASALGVVLARPARKPAFIRWALLCLLPPLIVAYPLFGIWGEVRFFYEVFPVAFVAALQNAVEAAGLALPARPEWAGVGAQT